CRYSPWGTKICRRAAGSPPRSIRSAPDYDLTRIPFAVYSRPADHFRIALLDRPETYLAPGREGEVPKWLPPPSSDLHLRKMRRRRHVAKRYQLLPVSDCRSDKRTQGNNYSCDQPIGR